MKDKEVTVNQNSNNQQQAHLANNSNNQQNLEEQAILSGDECLCIYCSAIIFINFNNKQIPISQHEYDNFLFNSYTPLFLANKILLIK